MRFLFVSLLAACSLLSAHGQIICPAVASSGDPLFCLVQAPEDVESLYIEIQDPQKRCIASTEAFLLGRQSSGGSVYGGFLGLASNLREDAYAVKARGQAKGLLFRYSVPLWVEAAVFVRETIELDSFMTDLLKVPDPEKSRQSRQLEALLGTVNTNSVYHIHGFQPPVASQRRTSGFGDIRRYVYSDGSQQYRIHGGIDFGVPEGTPVYACAAGRVAMATDRILTGNSVVLEHLPGLYSVYFHLDSLNVREGEEVSQGRQIGTSGSTGLATGPHLHWEIRAAGVAVNPDAFCMGEGIAAAGVRESGLDIVLLSDVDYSSSTAGTEGR